MLRMMECVIAAKAVYDSLGEVITHAINAVTNNSNDENVKSTLLSCRLGMDMALSCVLLKVSLANNHISHEETMFIHTIPNTGDLVKLIKDVLRIENFDYEDLNKCTQQQRENIMEIIPKYVEQVAKMFIDVSKVLDKNCIKGNYFVDVFSKFEFIATMFSYIDGRYDEKEKELISEAIKELLVNPFFAIGE